MKIIHTLVFITAALFHEQWRKDWQSRPGNTPSTPRPKPTTDETWLMAAGKQPGSTGECDLNTPFFSLPADWQADNLAAAELALEVMDRPDILELSPTPENLAKAGDAIHSGWLERRRAAEGETDEFKKLDVPFEQLEQWRKDQDTVQARIAQEVLLAFHRFK